MTTEKKKGCSPGCLKVAIIAFVVIVGVGYVQTLISDYSWKKERPEIVASAQQAIEAGDYETVFSLVEPHESRNDAGLNALLSKAQVLRREAQQRAKQERIVALVAQIKESTGDERDKQIQQLFSLDPRTEEFPDEIAVLRERAEKQRLEAERLRLEAAEQAAAAKKIADDFIANIKGKKFTFTKTEIYGTPETLEGTNNKYWIAYLPKIDVSFVSDKTTDEVIFVDRGKKAAPEYLATRDAARKKRLEGGFSAWDGSHRGLTKVIKEAMNDPKSYEHADTKFWDMGDHLVVTTTYRGKNAFGGVVKNWVKAKTDLDGNVLEIIEEGQ